MRQIRKRSEDRKGFIYLIVAKGLNALKIGYTDGEPEDRLRALQCGCPVELELAAALRGTMAHEREYHSEFEDYRLRGEWFDLTAKPVADFLFISEYDYSFGG